MGKIRVVVLAFFIMFFGSVGAIADSDIYTLTAWQADGRLDKEIQMLGRVTDVFFQKSGRVRRREQISYSITADKLREKIQILQKRSIENRYKTGNEQVLVVSISTHGWVYNNQHYLSVQGEGFSDLRDVERCVTQYDYTQTDVECGMLSSGELGEIFQSSTFDKIIFLTSACYSGQIIEDFKISSLKYPKVIVIASTDKNHTALAGVFEKALENYFNEVGFSGFARSTAVQIQEALKKGSKLVVTFDSLSLTGLSQTKIFFQQVHIGQFGVWGENEPIL